MPQRLPANYLQLIYHAAWRSYWRKKELKNFLRRCGVADALLAQLSDDKEIKKQDWLDYLFPKLEDTERGRTILDQMGRSLSAQITFPDLQGWENSKELIAAATKAVADLYEYLERVDEEKWNEKEVVRRRKEGEERRAAAIKSQETLESLRTRLDTLAMTVLGTVSGGFDFQKWFYDFMDVCEIENRRPYKTDDGRQVDGSITLDGTTYIVELKFTTGAAELTDVDSFLKKVNDKADNTMGIMVSMSSFTDGAKKNASFPRTPILLFDYSHLYMALTRVMSFNDVIRRVRRHSSQEGKAFLAVAEFSG